MEKSWFDIYAVNKIDDEEKRLFYKSIIADRKPYFMKYIYPELSRQYISYVKRSNRNCLREFGMTVAELQMVDNKTEEQIEFIGNYSKYLPVGVGDCVMNKICRRFEEEFDGILGRKSEECTYDYTNLKYASDYTESQKRDIGKLYASYNKSLQSYRVFSKYENIDDTESYASLDFLKKNFRAECEKICPNEKVLCDIVVDIAYSKSTTKKFAWDMCGNTIIENLLDRNDRIIHIPVACHCGDVAFSGEKFYVNDVRMEVS